MSIIQDATTGRRSEKQFVLFDEESWQISVSLKTQKERKKHFQ